VILASALCAALGAALGSFVGLCLDRIPRRQSIVHPPSHCRACQRALAATDLVPVLSYLQRRGRCRYCGAPIGPHLLALELAGAGALAVLPVWLGPPAGMAAALAIVALAAVIPYLAERLTR